MPDHSCSKDIFPNIQSKPALAQLEAISSCPITGYLGEETNTPLTTTSFEVVVRVIRSSLTLEAYHCKMYHFVIKLKDFLVKRISDQVLLSTSTKVRGPAPKQLRAETDAAASTEQNARGESLNSAETGGKTLTDTNG